MSQYICMCSNFINGSMPYKPTKSIHFTLKTTNTLAIFENVTGFLLRIGQKFYVLFYMPMAKGRVEVLLPPGSTNVFEVILLYRYLVFL